MRRGMDGLAALVQQAFGQDPFCGAVYRRKAALERKRGPGR
ncbi:MAG: IS66 family insertion sequence element accessory protein TnpB, partial [Rhodobacter sp.]|nr:IS66 family insertion sequence element accessory protein TnpB [Rhodobacter sp.]